MAQQDAVTQYWAETQCTGQRSSSLIKVCHVSAMLPTAEEGPSFNWFQHFWRPVTSDLNFQMFCKDVFTAKSLKKYCVIHKRMMTLMGLSKKCDL